MRARRAHRSCDVVYESRGSMSYEYKDDGTCIYKQYNIDDVLDGPLASCVWVSNYN